MPDSLTPRLSMVEFLGGGPEVSVATPGDAWLDGGSDAVTRLRERINATAEEGFTAAVVCGEAGSGRLRVARCLHATSRRAGASLAVVDGDDAELMHCLGALREANGGDGGGARGNIVLRRVERASTEAIAAAVELLTTQGIELRCGLIMTTDEPLAALRARSLEHGQLFARCGRAMLQVPNLAARRADIPTLTKLFVADAVSRFGKAIRGVTPQAVALLQRREYPGNVRELAGLIEQAVLTTVSDWLTVEDFPRLGESDEPPARRGELVIRLPGNSLREIELQALRLALELTDGRIVRAAELLGITRHALRRKLEKHGLNDLRRASQRPDDDSDDDAVI